MSEILKLIVGRSLIPFILLASWVLNKELKFETITVIIKIQSLSEINCVHTLAQ